MRGSAPEESPQPAEDSARTWRGAVRLDREGVFVRLQHPSKGTHGQGIWGRGRVCSSKTLRLQWRWSWGWGR